MKVGRVYYRTRQFWHALSASPAPQELDQIRSFLPTSLMGLFTSMAPDEQAHSFSMFTKLLHKGETHPDLLTAALLHDVGKSRFPLQLWERMLIVLGKAFFPNRMKGWGSLPGGELISKERWLARTLKKPFRVALHHPSWGAEMAKQAGASPLAVDLIRRHQDPLQNEQVSQKDYLLIALQAVDDES